MQSIIKKITSNHLLKRNHVENNENNNLINNKKNSVFRPKKRSALGDISNYSLNRNSNKNDNNILKRKDLKSSLIKDGQRTKLKSRLHSLINQPKENNYNNKSISNQSQLLTHQTFDNTQNINYSNLNNNKSNNNNSNNNNEYIKVTSHRNGLAISNGNSGYTNNQLNNFSLNNTNNVNKENKYGLKRKEMVNPNKNEILIRKNKKIDSYCVNTKPLTNTMNFRNNSIGSNNTNVMNNEYNFMEKRMNQNQTQSENQNENRNIQQSLLMSQNNNIKKGVKRSRPSFSPDGKFSVTNKTLFSPKIKRLFIQPREETNSNSLNQPSSFNPTGSISSNINNTNTLNIQNTYTQNYSHTHDHTQDSNQKDSLINILNSINDDHNEIENSHHLNNVNNVNININNSINNNSNSIMNSNLKRKRSCSSIHSIAVELKKRNSTLDSTENLNSLNAVNFDKSGQDQGIINETVQNTLQNSLSRYGSSHMNNFNHNNITSGTTTSTASSNNNNNLIQSVSGIGNSSVLSQNKGRENQFSKSSGTLKTSLKRHHQGTPVELNQSSIQSYYSKHSKRPNLHTSSSSISDRNISRLIQMSTSQSSINHSDNTNTANYNNNSKYSFIKNKSLITPLQKENSSLTLVNNSVSMQSIPNTHSFLSSANTTMNTININKDKENNSRILGSVLSKSNFNTSINTNTNTTTNTNVSTNIGTHIHHNDENSFSHNHSHSHSHSHSHLGNSFRTNYPEDSILRSHSNVNQSASNTIQKSMSVLSSTSTLMNSFSYMGSCSRPTEKILNTTEKEKSFMKYLESNTNTDVSLSHTNKTSSKKTIKYDPISLSEYSTDIYNYMKEVEMKMLPDPNYVERQKEVTWSARTILVNWIVEVHWKFKMQPETLYLAINIIDRFLSVKSIKLNKFQLLGLCALFISAKYEETVVPSIKDLVYIVNNMYTNEEIIQAERCVLVLLGFDLGYPGPMNFLRRISKADGYDTKTRTLAKYLIEITLLDEHFLSCPSSVVAGAAVLLARKILFNDQNWNKLFIYYSGYEENVLIPVAQDIINYALPKAEHRQLPFIKRKYSIDSFKKVSLYVTQWIKKQCLMEKMNQEEIQKQ